MTADQCAERQASRENLVDQLIHALQKADAILWVQENMKGIDHTVVRVEIKTALDRAYKESLK